jgi:hypothetical protein
MLTKEEARLIALRLIAPIAYQTGQDLIILEKAVVETAVAWAFPFNSRAYAETADFRVMVIGLGPVVVNRRLGAAEIAPSSMPIARFLAHYEANLPGAGGGP